METSTYLATKGIDIYDKAMVTLKLFLSFVVLLLVVSAFGISLFSKHVLFPLCRWVRYYITVNYISPLYLGTTSLDYQLLAL